MPEIVLRRRLTSAVGDAAATGKRVQWVTRLRRDAARGAHCRVSAVAADASVAGSQRERAGRVTADRRQRHHGATTAGRRRQLQQRSEVNAHLPLPARSTHTHSPVRTDRFLHRPRAVLSGCGSIRHGRPGLVRTQCAPLKHMTACGHYSSRSPPNSTVNSHSQTRSLSAVGLALLLLRQ